MEALWTASARRIQCALTTCCSDSLAAVYSSSFRAHHTHRYLTLLLLLLPGVVVSFFEWVQNLQNFQWDDEEVSRKLDR
jgi:hypothetical protein